MSASDKTVQDQYDSAKSPLALARDWWEQGESDAQDDDERRADPNALALATVDVDGRPTNRMVALSDIDDVGLVFGTDETSPKGRDIAARPSAAGVLFWAQSQRQIRVNGVVQRLSAQESDALFDARSPRSRAATIAAHQSAPMGPDTRDELLTTIDELLESDNLHRPDTWHGYRIVPLSLEFWQGRRDRIHERLLLTRSQAQEFAEAGDAEQQHWLRTELQP